MKFSIITSFVTMISLSAALPTTPVPRSDGHELFTRQFFCYDNGRCSLDDAYALANRFINQGNSNCAAGGNDWTLASIIGSCRFYSRTVGTTNAYSYCKDVGYGLQNIASTCDDGLGTTAGQNTAGGNGNYQIMIQTIDP